MQLLTAHHRQAKEEGTIKPCQLPWMPSDMEAYAPPNQSRGLLARLSPLRSKL